jgi:hypothetical protein
MKKLILIAMVALLASCTESTVKITDETTELPNKVVKSLDDTTLVKQYAIVETNDKLYLLTKKDTEKKFFVEKTIDKEENSDGVYAVMFILIVIIVFMFLNILDSY